MKPAEDEITEEIRRHREDHARAFDFDLKRITEDLQRLERESGTLVVTRPSRPPLASTKRSSA